MKIKKENLETRIVRKSLEYKREERRKKRMKARGENLLCIFLHLLTNVYDLEDVVVGCEG